MASIVGRSGVPRGVKKKSAGKSNCVNVFSDGKLKRRKTGSIGWEIGKGNETYL
jgi:hypothetical protein